MQINILLMDIFDLCGRTHHHRNVLVMYKRRHWKVGEEIPRTSGNIVYDLRESCSLLIIWPPEASHQNCKQNMLLIFRYLIMSRLFHHWNNITWLWKILLDLTLVSASAREIPRAYFESLLLFFKTDILW